MLLLVLGCAEVPAEPLAFCEGESRYAYDPDPDGEFQTFPDDFWTVEADTSTGLRVEMDPSTMGAFADFPENYLEWFDFLSTLDGFGLNAGLYFQFDGALPIEAIGRDRVFLVSLEEGGPTWHEPEITFTDYDHTLLLKPRRPLPPGTTVIAGLLNGEADCVSPSTYLRELADPALGVEYPLAERYRTALDAAGIDPASLAAMTLFTTQSATEQGLAVAGDVASTTFSITPGTCADTGAWRRCEGSLRVNDYRGSDGLVPPGAVAVRSTYDLPLSAWLPPGKGPFPVVVCGHGLGGDRGQCEDVVATAAAEGLALIGIDAVEHGDHPGRTEADLDAMEPLMIFGIRLSPPGLHGLKLRDNFRQSAWDKLQLVEAIRAGVDWDGDGVDDLDPERIGYAGVSLGGIMGAEPLALSPHLDAGLLVVGGGRVTQIIEDSPTFSILIELMKPSSTSDGEVDRAFPLLQTMMDPGDPMTWAPRVQSDRADDRSAPDVMLMAAYNDEIVPNSTNDLLATAFAAPGVGSEVWPVQGVTFTAGSVSGNGPGGASLGYVQAATVHGGGVAVPAEHDNVHSSDEGLAAIEAFFRPVFFEGEHGVVTDPGE